MSDAVVINIEEPSQVLVKIEQTAAPVINITTTGQQVSEVLINIEELLTNVII